MSMYLASSLVNMNQFLQEYKQLEGYAKAAGYDSVLDIEQQMTDQEEQEKLKLCRITRNYIVHHADGTEFAAVSDGMISFIQGLSTSLIADKLKAEDRMSSLTPVKLTDTLSGATKKLLKANLPWIPVVGPQMVYIGVLDTNLVLDLIRQGMNVDTPLSEIKKLQKDVGKEAEEKKVPVIAANAPITELEGTPAIVLDGKRKKYKGVIKQYPVEEKKNDIVAIATNEPKLRRLTKSTPVPSVRTTEPSQQDTIDEIMSTRVVPNVRTTEPSQS